MENSIATAQEIAPGPSDLRDMPSMRHFGNTIPLKYTRADGEPKYVLGPHFMVFLCTLMISSLFAVFLIYNIVAGAQQKQLQIGIALSLALAFYIYSYAAIGFSNPGLASTYEEPEEQIKTRNRYCVPCKIIRPQRTIHCYTCDVCITGYDHHCPWVGKCVGAQNLCQFKRFLFSVLLLLFSLGLSMYISDQYMEPAQKGGVKY